MRIKDGYIPEIVGLRGLALALVVVFHLLGEGRVSGGVDVFLFLSGFLLTLSMLRKVEREGSFSLTRQYGRILRRLVPAALTVLVAVSIATILILPRPRWAQVGSEILASTLYYENWELINSQLAYGAAGPATSPLQHFWSMSVQGQFFLLWPLILVAVLLTVGRRPQRFRAVVGVLSVVLAAGSFAQAQLLLFADQAVNYLHSGSRLWELVIGAALATVYPFLDLPDRIKSWLAWLGLSMIVAAGFFIDGAEKFPAYPALVPVLGAALVVVGAGPDTRFSVRRALHTRPMNFLATISYPLYLWHWPVLIFYMEYRSIRGVGMDSALAILGLSLLLAWATQMLVAGPAMANATRLSVRRLVLPSMASLLVFAVAVAACVGYLSAWEERELAAVPSGVSAYHPGALVLTGDASIPPEGWVARSIPGLTAAERDVPVVYSKGCIQNHRSEPGMEEVLICAETDVPQAQRTIVMSGGSHVIHWYDALKAVALRNDWALIVVDKDGCRLGLAEEPVANPSSCGRWNESAREVIRGLEPDAIFTVGTRTSEEPGVPEEVASDEVRVWEYFSDSGIPTIVVRDTPRFLERVPDCLATVGLDNAALCSRPEADIYLAQNPLQQVELPGDTVSLDLRHAFCSAGSCDVVIGNVVAYRDQDHITSTYSKTLSLALERELRAEAPWLFESA